MSSTLRETLCVLHMVSTSCENVVFLWCYVDRTVMKR
jgi:hypothetical protein